MARQLLDLSGGARTNDGMTRNRDQPASLIRRRQRQNSILLPHPGQPVDIADPVRVSPRVATYHRRSMLAETSVSLARQHEECADLVARLGGRHDPATDAFYDDDISARGGKLRPALECLLRLVQEGHYDGVVIYELARLVRNRHEALVVKKVFLEAPCDVYSVAEPTLTLFGPLARAFDLVLEQAVSESDSTAERVTSYHGYMQVLGAVRSKRPYGMVSEESGLVTPGRAAAIHTLAPDDDPRPELRGRTRADLIREAAARLLSNDSTADIVKSFNDAGYPSCNGKLWTTTGLRMMLRNPSYAGLAHRNRRLIGLDGQPLPLGAEPLRVGRPVLSEENWFALQRIVGATPAAATKIPRARPERILIGIVICGNCGKLMNRRPSKRSDAYVCTYHALTAGAGCPGNTIAAARTDKLVVDIVVAREANRVHPRADGADVTDLARIDEEIGALRRKLSELEDLWLDTELKDAHAKARFNRRRESLESAIRSGDKQRSMLASAARESPAARDLSDLSTQPASAQRATVLSAIDGVVVGPAQSRGGKYNPARVRILWRD